LFDESKYPLSIFHVKYFYCRIYYSRKTIRFTVRDGLKYYRTFNANNRVRYFGYKLFARLSKYIARYYLVNQDRANKFRISTEFEYDESLLQCAKPQEHTLSDLAFLFPRNNRPALCFRLCKDYRYAYAGVMGYNTLSSTFINEITFELFQVRVVIAAVVSRTSHIRETKPNVTNTALARGTSFAAAKTEFTCTKLRVNSSALLFRINDGRARVLTHRVCF